MSMAMSEELSVLVDTLKDSLNLDKCVLILGPHIYIREMNGQVLEKREYFSSLGEKIPQTEFFPSDEVFQTKHTFTLQQRVKDFYTGGGDIQLLESISNVRFPLIINASPDESLPLYLKKMDGGIQFDYFEGDIDQKKQLSFSRERPLIYNVFGKASDPQSLILSYKKLYEAMQQLLPVGSFPPSIQEYLKYASSFLFLGFKFDTWTYQLLSYKIAGRKSIDDEKMRLSSRRYEKDNNINVIVTETLGIEFTEEPPIQLLSKLIRKIKDSIMPHLLRNIGRHDKFTSFVSYSRASLSFVEVFVQRFHEQVKILNEDEISKIELKMLYDKEDIWFGQSIDSFMTRIGRGKTVVLFISENYLSSEYCMTEALRTSVYHQRERHFFDERVFIALIRNGLQLDLKQIERSIIHYQQIWEQKLADLLSPGDKPDKEKIVNFVDIRDFIPDFIRCIADTHCHVIDIDHIDEDMLDRFILQLINKMKED